MNKEELLKHYFGYDSFRKGQEQLINAILDGRDVLGIMPTGAGKSICYQIPALMLPGITIVVSPLISLMKDQVQSLNQAGIHAAYINSSLTDGQITRALSLAAAGTYKIIYVAPERLESAEFLRFACNTEISMVAVDEAHCISQWGQDFRPSYLNIVRFTRQLPKRHVIAAFTATATEAVKEDILCVLSLRDPEVLVTGFDRENLFFCVETPASKDNYVLDYLRQHNGQSGIIYCATRKNVDKLYEMLCLNDIPAARYHAGLSAEVRKNSQDAFIFDMAPVMVATNAFGMGIDKSNVRYVIHYNMPQSMENYYQEAGRAGRDGANSECILLYSQQDVAVNRFLLQNKDMNPELTSEEIRTVRERDEERLRAMMNYCLTRRCLRDYILRYFGEHPGTDCGNCSNCLKEFEEKDYTEAAVSIVKAVQEMRGRYGINVVAGTLAGEKRAKLREYGVTELEQFGALTGWDEFQIKDIIREMVLEEILFQGMDKYGLIRPGKKYREILDGTIRLKMRVPVVSEAQQQNTETSSKSRRNRKSARRSDLLNSRGLELFEQLRTLRLEIAKEESVPPYIVFSDKTLTDMCVKLPLDRDEMLEVSGVGENKLARYGERFLNSIRSFSGGEKEKLYFG